jgi:cytochrome P450
MLAEHQAPAFDLLAPASLANPYPLYKQMRDTDPVHYSEANRFWVLTRYSDVEDALRDDRLSADRSSCLSAPTMLCFLSYIFLSSLSYSP